MRGQSLERPLSVVYGEWFAARGLQHVVYSEYFTACVLR